MFRKAIAVIITLTLAGCNNSVKVASLSTDELAAEVAGFFEMALVQHTEQSHIEAFIGADFDDIEEITLIQQALTVHLAEIIIIKPKENRMDSVMEFLRARRTVLREQLAFYPLQTAAAEAMVVGSRHNVAYLICHEDADVAEAALLKLINENI